MTRQENEVYYYLSIAAYHYCQAVHYSARGYGDLSNQVARNLELGRAYDKHAADAANT